MGILILGAFLVGLALSGLLPLSGIYFLIRQKQRATVWQVLTAFVTAVVLWIVDFGDWMARIDKQRPSERASHFIPLAFVFGFVPGGSVCGGHVWIGCNQFVVHEVSSKPPGEGRTFLQLKTEIA